MATATMSKTTVRPLEDRLLVKPAAAETKTKSGLFLPEQAKEKPMRGVVVAVGPGPLSDEGQRTALTVKVGNEVVYGKYAGTEIEIDGEKHLILRENELLGIIED